MSSTRYTELWGAGREDSVRILLSRIIDRARRNYGSDAVTLYSENRMTIALNNVWLNFDCKPDQFRISPPLEHTDIDANQWNQALAKFHQDIVEPIKDNIGGVATGIGFMQSESDQ